MKIQDMVKELVQDGTCKTEKEAVELLKVMYGALADCDCDFVIEF